MMRLIVLAQQVLAKVLPVRAALGVVQLSIALTYS